MDNAHRYSLFFFTFLSIELSFVRRYGMWITAINKESNTRDRVRMMNYEDDFKKINFILFSEWETVSWREYLEHLQVE